MRERPDLNVPQVAGSALAAVLAAKLASSFGVYGTILGAGVVSVVATCGGSLFQHFFRRTGEQLREATTTGGAPERAPAPGEFSAGTVHRARGRGLRRPVLVAALVFGVTMAGITAYELASGSSFSGGGGTTVSDAVSGRGSSSGNSTDSSRTPESTPSPDSTAPSGSGGAASPAPSPSEAPRGETPAPSATPLPTAGTGGTTPAPSPSATDPAPSADSRSGTADPDPTGPAAP